MSISSVKRSAVAGPVITVVVVDYRKGARVVANVRSLHRQYRADRLEIVVIDNSVDPANAALLEPLGSLPGVRLVVTPRNVGYTAACNQRGRKSVGSDQSVAVRGDLGGD